MSTVLHCTFAPQCAHPSAWGHGRMPARSGANPVCRKISRSVSPDGFGLLTHSLSSPSSLNRIAYRLAPCLYCCCLVVGSTPVPARTKAPTQLRTYQVHTYWIVGITEHKGRARWGCTQGVEQDAVLRPQTWRGGNVTNTVWLGSWPSGGAGRDD